MAVVSSRAAALASLLGLAAGCRPVAVGLGLADAAAVGSPAPFDDAAGADAGEDLAPVDLAMYGLLPSDASDLKWDPPVGASGPADMIGCSDGSREGFVEPGAWQNIAGCAGAWSLPGLQNARARTPQCGRAAGDNGMNPRGTNCSVADLCAEGWHVCEDADDVAASSPTGCESASPLGYAAFFVVRGGATWGGVCGPDREWSNDLHGCGSYGRAESQDCWPLSRRFGFADCADTAGVWLCGGPDQHLDEGSYVAKNGGALGGALCCRDR
jgi:hypothetical protein